MFKTPPRRASFSGGSSDSNKDYRSNSPQPSVNKPFYSALLPPSTSFPGSGSLSGDDGSLPLEQAAKLIDGQGENPPNFSPSEIKFFQTVSLQANTGMIVTKRVRSFLNNASKILENAALEWKNLVDRQKLKLSQMSSPDGMTTTIQAVESFFDTMMGVSEVLANLTYQVKVQCVNSLKELDTQKTQEITIEGNQMIASMKSSHESLQKTKENCQTLLSDLSQKEKKDKDSTSPARTTSRPNVLTSLAILATPTQNRSIDKVRRKARKATLAYGEEIQKANNLHEKIQKTLSEIQNMESLRMSRIKTTLAIFSSLVLTFCSHLTGISEETRRTGNLIDVRADIDNYFDHGPEQLNDHHPSEKPEEVSLFNCTLENVMKYQLRALPNVHIDLPLLVPCLLHNIEVNGGLSSEGIFRISPAIEDPIALQAQLETGDYAIKENFNPNIPAALLKAWLRSLKEPLIASAYYTTCIEIGKMQVSAGSLRIKAIIDLLPCIHRHVLFRILVFLNKVTANSDVNKMTAANLATVFAPCLLRAPTTSTDLAQITNNTKSSINFIQSLIRDVASYFETYHYPDDADYFVYFCQQATASASSSTSASSSLSSTSTTLPPVISLGSPKGRAPARAPPSRPILPPRFQPTSLPFSPFPEEGKGEETKKPSLGLHALTIPGKLSDSRTFSASIEERPSFPRPAPPLPARPFSTTHIPPAPTFTINPSLTDPHIQPPPIGPPRRLLRAPPPLKNRPRSSSDSQDRPLMEVESSPSSVGSSGSPVIVPPSHTFNATSPFSSPESDRRGQTLNQFPSSASVGGKIGMSKSESTGSDSEKEAISPPPIQTTRLPPSPNLSVKRKSKTYASPPPLPPPFPRPPSATTPPTESSTPTSESFPSSTSFPGPPAKPPSRSSPALPPARPPSLSGNDENTKPSGDPSPNKKATLLPKSQTSLGTPTFPPPRPRSPSIGSGTVTSVKPKIPPPPRALPGHNRSLSSSGGVSLVINPAQRHQG